MLLKKLACPTRFERVTYGLEVSIIKNKRLQINTLHRSQNSKII